MGEFFHMITELCDVNLKKFFYSNSKPITIPVGKKYFACRFTIVISLNLKNKTSNFSIFLNKTIHTNPIFFKFSSEYRVWNSIPNPNPKYSIFFEYHTRYALEILDFFEYHTRYALEKLDFFEYLFC